MELLSLLFANSSTVFGVLGGIVTIASLVTAGTKTPNPDTKLGKAYKIIELLSLTIGRAKETGK